MGHAGRQLAHGGQLARPLQLLAVELVGERRGLLELGCHTVEGGTELADLVAARRLDPHREIAGTQSARRRDETAHRRDDPPGDDPRGREHDQGERQSEPK